MNRASRLSILIFAFILTFGTFNMASSQTKLKVGYIPNTGFLEEDRAGHLRGYGYEYMEFLARYGDWKFEYIPCTKWQECNEKLQSGLIDVLPAMPGDYRTLQNVTRTDHVIGRYPMKLVTHDGKIISQMRIGTIPSNAPLPSLPKVAANEGFSYELVNFSTFYDMEEAFQHRELDGYISPMLEPNKEINVASIFDRQSYRLLVRTDRTDLLAAMNIAMDEMLMDQPNIRNRLNDKYLRTGGFPLILNHQEKEYLVQKKVLKTAIFLKNKPYAYKGADNKIHGVIPRLIQQISDDLNIEIEIIDTTSPEETKQLIKNGQIDFVADCICDFSWANDMNMVPTQAYLQLDYVPVTRRGNNVEDNFKIVACAPDLLYTKNFIFPTYPSENRIYAENLQDCFKIVNEGGADVLYAPRSEVPYMIEETNSYNLEVASESDFSDELSLGVYTGSDSRLWRILNKEVNHLDTSKIHNSVNGEINAPSHFSLQWLIYHYPLRAMAIFLLIAAIIAAASWYRIRLRRRHTSQIHHLAYTDSRYNLPNVLYLRKEAQKILQQETESDFDSDLNHYIVHFATVDNNERHLKYDQILRSEQLKSMAEKLKSQDWVEIVSTGEEIGSLTCFCKAESNAAISKLALGAIHEYGYIVTKDSRIWIQIKAGICRVEGNDLTQIIGNAKIACDAATEEVLTFSTKLQEDLNFEEQVEANMETALKDGEFQAWYQSEYDLKTHNVVGLEVFVRWQSSKLGFLLPNKFMPIFERNGFIISVDYFILEEVCKFQRSRLDEKAQIKPISVNQSNLHLTEEHYIEKVKSIFKKYKLPRGIIKLEFSETAFEDLIQHKQIERITGILNALQKIGFSVTIDNFGKGYLSYNLLNQISIDEMKIDRGLIDSSVSSSRMKEILSSIITLGKKLKMRVACEGIESQEQEELLKNLGCEYGQGFLHSESAPLS